jgi:hypothetical protein
MAEWISATERWWSIYGSGGTLRTGDRSVDRFSGTSDSTTYDLPAFPAQSTLSSTPTVSTSHPAQDTVNTAATSTECAIRISSGKCEPAAV